MSLLMDALRRAEADKKAQEERAARAAQGESAAGDGAITRISPFAKSEDDTVQIDGQALQAAAAAHDDRLELALEIEEALAAVPFGPLSLEPMADDEAAHAATADIGPAGRAPGGEPGGYTTHAGRLDRHEETGTLPSPRGMRQDVNDYFDRSHSMEIPRVPPRTNDGTLDDVVAHTVASAQTVFRANERPRYARVALVAAIIAVGAVLTIVGIGVYYASLAPPPPAMPSPQVARGVEKPPQPSGAGPASGAPSSELARIDTTPPPATAPAPAPAAAPLPTPLAALAAPAAPTPTPPTPPAVGVPAARPRPDMARPSIHDEEIDSGQLRIARSRAPNVLETTVNAGYAALQRGDIDQAAALYNRARLLEPERRDTLLGLAAVAQQRGDRARAAAFYAEVLRRQPADPVASAALLSLTTSEGEAGAARLRMLLDAHGDAAYLHAALGQWYARAGRWADAQQAYFDAVRLDASHPDYAFNLAVSLDRLGQARAALEYYLKAVALSALRRAAFDPQVAATRIAALGGDAAP